VELKGESAYSWSYSHIKLSQSVYEKCNDQQLTNKAHLSAIAVTSIFRVLPTRWRRKPAGIDTEQNYVTVTLCIQHFEKIPIHDGLLVCSHHCYSQQQRQGKQTATG